MAKGTSRPARTLSADRAHQGPLVAAREVLEDRLRALELERVDLETALTALARLDGATPPPSLGYALTPKGRFAVAEGKAAKAKRTVKAPRAAKPFAALVQDAQDDVAIKARQVLSDGPLSVSAFVKKSGLSRHYVGCLVKDGVIVATGATRDRRLALPGAPPAKEAPSRG